ncbi:alpha/beta fold hydrolase [Solimonas soli]|uniref:alpha/beta fold hydrolase n=1 Tax=Solimonas soli TaxID=413479 RepID=UPI00048876AD|nr:alpha/beta hydrolase [Solimonas soli]
MENPSWLQRAIATPGVSRYADNGGIALHYLEWNDAGSGLPGLLFVPGYRAHLRWWDFIAPIFADRFHVVVMELSGMGDSGRRAHYGAGDFADDIVAVTRHSGLRTPIAVGHSYGGARLLRACSEQPAMFTRAVAVDSYVHFADMGPVAEHPRIGSGRVHATREAAMARFRLSPEQPAHPALLRYLAEGALREVDGGWTWKFDIRLPGGGPTEDDGAAILRRIPIPVHLVWGEHSLVVNEKCMRRVAATLPVRREPIMVPDAHHHLMLDQPIAAIGILQALLA